MNKYTLSALFLAAVLLTGLHALNRVESQPVKVSQPKTEREVLGPTYAKPEGVTWAEFLFPDEALRAQLRDDM